MVTLRHGHHPTRKSVGYFGAVLTIQIQTFYPGASAEVMTTSVTAPLERQLGQLLCIESEANRHDPKNIEPIGKFIEIDLFREAATL